MAKQGLYKGYSSFEFQRTKEFKVLDIELVKLDLLNHIFTQRGTRVMMATFGTTIPQLLFEPLDTEVLTTIEDELRDVFEADPRVELISLDVRANDEEQMLFASAKLNYIELNITEDFELNLQFEA